MKEELFRVIDFTKEPPHSYVVYTTGEIEGFGEAKGIVNSYPIRAREFLDRYIRRDTEIKSKAETNGKK